MLEQKDSGENRGFIARIYNVSCELAEKPITPYFVRILRRRPVGPSAMNYTNEDAFQNSDNGEIIDVPKVLVDKRRNKNVE